jgi:hypothetical protein
MRILVAEDDPALAMIYGLHVKRQLRALGNSTQNAAIYSPPITFNRRAQGSESVISGMWAGKMPKGGIPLTLMCSRQQRLIGIEYDLSGACRGAKMK